jgi:hypothetical protein
MQIRSPALTKKKKKTKKPASSHLNLPRDPYYYPHSYTAEVEFQKNRSAKVMGLASGRAGLR